MGKDVYCVVEVYEHFLPGDTSPWFETEPDYSTQFDKKEDAEAYCEKYNNEHKGWPKLQSHLMSEGDMKAWREEQKRDEMFDRW